MSLNCRANEGVTTYPRDGERETMRGATGNRERERGKGEREGGEEERRGAG